MVVGRRLVIGALCSAIDAAVGGAGGVVLLAGEAGMGKTALASEAVSYTKTRGAAAVWGTCWEGVHVLGRFGDEARLIRLASQLEAAQPWAAGSRP